LLSFETSLLKDLKTHSASAGQQELLMKEKTGNDRSHI